MAPMLEQPWTIYHFSLYNKKGKRQGNVPALLRSVARNIEELDKQLGKVTVYDVTFGTEITEDGPWHHMTVYYDVDKPDR